MRKVCVVVTARPSYSRIKTAIDAINNHPDLELQLVVGASALLDRYGSAVNYIEKDGFDIKEKIYSVIEGEDLTTMAKTTGLSLIELATVFDNLKPDVVLTIADRYETISTAIAASYMNIPVAHVQGGEVTGSIDEKVRHAVTKLSNIHFVSNKAAQNRIKKMGENPDSVFVTGCPSIDLAAGVIKSPDFQFDPIEKYGGVGSDIQLSNGYIVVMQHPVTTEYTLSRQQVTETLKAVTLFDLPVLWFWPNVDAGSEGTSKGIRAFREHHLKSNIRYFKNMEPVDFLYLLKNSKCIVGNSSVGIRECSFLGVPTVNIGSRQTGRERGKNIIDVDHKENSIKKAIDVHLKNGHYPSEHIYGDGNAGKRISELLSTLPLTIDKRLSY